MTLHFLVLKDSNDVGAYATLPGHEGTVTCIRFIGQDRLLSADDRGLVTIWRREGTKVILIANKIVLPLIKDTVETCSQ